MQFKIHATDKREEEEERQTKELHVALVVQSHTVFSSTPRGSGFRFTNERWGTDPAPPELPFHGIMDSSTVRPTVIMSGRVRVRVGIG